jgi:hypothetical protein
MTEVNADDAARKERNRQATRRYREANRERLREQRRKYYEANREKQCEDSRKWYRANQEHARANAKRQWKQWRHGMDGATWGSMWAAQQGKCRYCQRDLDETAHVDHWHGCASGHEPGKSCPACWRGLACQQCNIIIGMAADDPGRLDLIAANLRIANAEVGERQLKAPQQLMFEIE